MSEIGRKMIEGIKLTREEWEEARLKEIITGGKKVTYEGYLASHYESNKRRGYICSQHLHRAHIVDGVEWLCSWGLHLEDLSLEYLTDINVMYISYCFGKDALKEIGKRIKKREVNHGNTTTVQGRSPRKDGRRCRVS